MFRLYELVKGHMVHKPCDPSDPAYDPQESHPCINNKGVCSKRFPYQFQTETTCPENGFAQTRRRSPENGGFRIKWKKKDGSTPLTLISSFTKLAEAIRNQVVCCTPDALSRLVEEILISDAGKRSKNAFLSPATQNPKIRNAVRGTWK